MKKIGEDPTTQVICCEVITPNASNKEDAVIEYTVAKYRGDRSLFVVEIQVEL